MHNSFGEYFCLTTFGESHGKVIGVIIDGCPSGLEISELEIQKEMDRRQPGTSEIVTSRFESDQVEILSGIKNNRTTGAPITMIIKNEYFNSEAYHQLKKIPRPSHADYPALIRYGKWVDLDGGGRFSGRITASFVMAGAIAKKLLWLLGIKVAAYASSIGEIVDTNHYSINEIKKSPSITGMVDQKCADRAKALILQIKAEHDSIGGTVRCIVEGMPAGIGNMVFSSLESQLSAAIFAIPGIRGIEFGLGFEAAKRTGSQHNDPYTFSKKQVLTITNNAGGIIGGLSTGMEIVFNCAIKPPSTISKSQLSVNLDTKEPITVEYGGEHDPCTVPRVIPVIEALTAIVMVDNLIGNGKITQIIE